MARSHSKLSIHRAQPAHRVVSTVTTRKTNPVSHRIAPTHTVSKLPQVKGKTIKALEFIFAPEYQGISLSFQDKTFLDMKIEPFFTLQVDYQDRRTGKRRVLKRFGRR